MNRVLRVLCFVFFVVMPLIVSGCINNGCSAYTTGIEMIESNDDFVFFEYSSYFDWDIDAEKAELSGCRSDQLEFWLEVEVMEWADRNTNHSIGKRPESPPYKIISREIIKSKKPFGSSDVIYRLKVKVEDIITSIEKAI